MAEIYRFANFLPNTLNLTIRQILTPPNIPAIRYSIVCAYEISSKLFKRGQSYGRINSTQNVKPDI